jgi:S1-C subfamily serine protease
LLDFQNNRAKYALVALPSIFLLTVFSLLFLPTVLAEEILDTSENQEISLGEEIVNFEQPLSLIEIFERSESGVVSIFVNKSSDFGETSGEGSGFVYDKTGNIITNNHVVENAERISDSSNLKVGAQVTAIGNPFGLSGSMTSGIISQLGRTLPAQGTNFSIPDIIQTDAAINPGNSGGPLLDMNGDVIGINTAIYSNGGDFSGVGFSIPSNIALKIVPTIIKEGEYLHPWIGITTLNITPDLAEVLSLENAKGVLVMTVVKDSPADKANLRGSSNTTILEGVEYQVGGDIIVSVDEKEVRQIDDILATLQRDKGVGDELKLEVIRDGKTMDIVVNLEKRPDT